MMWLLGDIQEKDVKHCIHVIIKLFVTLNQKKRNFFLEEIHKIGKKDQ